MQTRKWYQHHVQRLPVAGLFALTELSLKQNRETAALVVPVSGFQNLSNIRFPDSLHFITKFFLIQKWKTPVTRLSVAGLFAPTKLSLKQSRETAVLVVPVSGFQILGILRFPDDLYFILLLNSFGLRNEKPLWPDWVWLASLPWRSSP